MLGTRSRKPFPQIKIYHYVPLVARLLTTCPYVVVIADFSKAFDNVLHSTLLNKMTDLDIPDDVYNWPVSYFSGHSHGGESSALLEISAGIIHGSGIGPASYVVNSSDLAALTPGNFLRKYADDTYIIIPSDNRKSSPTWIRGRRPTT